MAGIQLSGLVSGLDTKTIVAQLMSIEKQPRTRIELQQSSIQARQTNLREISSKLSALKLAAHDLGSAALWADTQSVTSTDDTKVAVRTTGGVGPGGYDVAVQNLASASRRTYTFTQPTADDTPLTVTKNDGTTTTFLLKAGATVDDAVSAINANPDAGVFAVNVNSKLVLASRTTGASSTFTAAGAATLDAGSEVDGVDATYSIGTATGLKSPTNVIANAIPGVELTLKAKTDGVTVNVGAPEPDRSQVKTKLKAFVEAYNAAVTTMKTDLDEKRVPNAANATDASKGSLFGDTGVADILSTLRTAVGDMIPGFTGTTTASGITTLAALGISTGAANTGTTVNGDAVSGKLVFDEKAFDAALDKDPVGVRKLLGGVIGTDGFAQAFEAKVAVYSQTGGLLDSRINAAQDEINRIKDSLDRFDMRMETRQTFLERQFTALESALSQSQSLQSQIAARLGPSS
jgi:flagellar hook-associated protein 2